MPRAVRASWRSRPGITAASSGSTTSASTGYYRTPARLPRWRLRSIKAYEKVDVASAFRRTSRRDFFTGSAGFRVKGPILGWDVGGANLKAARIAEDDTSEPRMLERPFPLWREPHRLPAILREAADCLGTAATMAVTTTAELADCFATKREGVAFVLDAFHTAFPDVLFLDVGSTTTDVIPIVAGRVAVKGRTDPARLRSGELVYTGRLRTPVCAIVRAVPLGGRRCRIAAEHFAVAADVHRWLGRIDESEYTCETPDGRGRSRLDAAARIARMVCADLEMIGHGEVTAIANHISRAQVRQIAGGIRQVMRRLGPACPRLAVLAGEGTFLARAAAEEVGLAPRDLADEVGS